MKAVIAVDDWKLPVFRRRLTAAGFKYTDAGAGPGETTFLSVPYEAAEFVSLSSVVTAAQAECARTGRPRK